MSEKVVKKTKIEVDRDFVLSKLPSGFEAQPFLPAALLAGLDAGVLVHIQQAYTAAMLDGNLPSALQTAVADAKDAISKMEADLEQKAGVHRTKLESAGYTGDDLVDLLARPKELQLMRAQLASLVAQKVDILREYREAVCSLLFKVLCTVDLDYTTSTAKTPSGPILGTFEVVAFGASRVYAVAETTLTSYALVGETYYHEYSFNVVVLSRSQLQSIHYHLVAHSAKLAATGWPEEPKARVAKLQTLFRDKLPLPITATNGDSGVRVFTGTLTT